MPFVDRTPSTERAQEAPLALTLRYAQIMPLMSALNALAHDGPTHECRAQALALTACRVLLPHAQSGPLEAHDAYANVLRALLTVPSECWPAEGRAIRASAETLMTLI